MNASIAINAYKKVGTESKVIGADPHQLISLLFQGALESIAMAKDGITRKDVEAKGKAISKAIAIIGEGLHSSLNKKAGGDLAQNLSVLYDYMVRRLVEANINNDIAVLDEVDGLLAGLAEAWDGIRPATTQPLPPANAATGAYLAYARA